MATIKQLISTLAVIAAFAVPAFAEAENDADALIHRADQQLASGDSAGAFESYRTAAEDNPRHERLAEISYTALCIAREIAPQWQALLLEKLFAAFPQHPLTQLALFEIYDDDAFDKILAMEKSEVLHGCDRSRAQVAADLLVVTMAARPKLRNAEKLLDLCEYRWLAGDVLFDEAMKQLQSPEFAKSPLKESALASIAFDKSTPLIERIDALLQSHLSAASEIVDLLLDTATEKECAANSHLQLYRATRLIELEDYANAARLLENVDPLLLAHVQAKRGMVKESRALFKEIAKQGSGPRQDLAARLANSIEHCEQDWSEFSAAIAASLDHLREGNGIELSIDVAGSRRYAARASVTRTTAIVSVERDGTMLGSLYCNNGILGIYLQRDGILRMTTTVKATPYIEGYYAASRIGGGKLNLGIGVGTKGRDPLGDLRAIVANPVLFGDSLASIMRRSFSNSLVVKEGNVFTVTTFDGYSSEINNLTVEFSGEKVRWRAGKSDRIGPAKHESDESGKGHVNLAATDFQFDLGFAPADIPFETWRASLPHDFVLKDLSNPNDGIIPQFLVDLIPVCTEMLAEAMRDAGMTAQPEVDNKRLN
jgi:hypothetical protein